MRKKLDPKKQLRQAKAAANKSKHNHRIFHAWQTTPMGEPETELHFHPTRKWRLDFAWPQYKIAIEVNGGGGRGRHNTLAGATKDYEKINAAQLLGWIVLQYSVVSVKDEMQIAADLIAAMLLRAKQTRGEA